MEKLNLTITMSLFAFAMSGNLSAQDIIQLKTLQNDKGILLLIALILHFSFLHTGIVILNGLTHSYKIENGKVYKGKVAIENTSTNTQNVKLFLHDFAYHADGAINYSTLRTNKRNNGEWIKLNINLITLKGKEKTEGLYEIIIPDQVRDAGSYWSVIIVEPVEDIKPSDGNPGVGFYVLCN